jgi:hypothetical protein
MLVRNWVDALDCITRESTCLTQDWIYKEIGNKTAHLVNMDLAVYLISQYCLYCTLCLLANRAGFAAGDDIVLS